MSTATRLCHCGSGLQKRELLDARGIFCAYVCDVCESEKRKGYRPEIFTNANYDAPDLGDDEDDGNSPRSMSQPYGDPMQGISYPAPSMADTVAVPMWALDCILLRADFYDKGEDNTSEDLQAALDVVLAVMQNARCATSE